MSEVSSSNSTSFVLSLPFGRAVLSGPSTIWPPCSHPVRTHMWCGLRRWEWCRKSSPDKETRRVGSEELSWESMVGMLKTFAALSMSMNDQESMILIGKLTIHHSDRGFCKCDSLIMRIDCPCLNCHPWTGLDVPAGCSWTSSGIALITQY